MLAAVLLSARVLFASSAVLSHFEGGSIGEVKQLSPDHLACAVVGQSDQDHRNRQANWYYFELTRLRHAPLTIDLVNLAGEYNYRAPAYAVNKDTRPVYSFDNVHWTHFTDSEVSWNAADSQLTLRFTPASDHVWIAHVPPYTNRDLARLLAAFRSSPYLHAASVGHTVMGREMPLLTITNPRIPDARKKVIWLMFRQHAWETGSSWAGEGAIRFLLADDEKPRSIRDANVFKVFPMADPDGVALGGVRFNRNGYDLNRNWDKVDSRLMPEIAAQRKAMLDWVDAGYRFDLFLSLHNTESGEYLEAPPQFHSLGESFFQNLRRSTSFNPTVPLRNMDETTTPGKPGRMTVDQGLYHDRQLPAMLREQMVDFNSKLGRCPEVADRQAFGAGLVQAAAEAVSATGQPSASSPAR